MISDVVIVGVAKENLKRGFRNFEVDSIEPLSEKKVQSILKVNYWTREDFSRLNRIKANTVVVIKGRLENDDEYGVYIIAESIFPCS